MSQTETKRKWQVLCIPPIVYVIFWKICAYSLNREVDAFYASGSDSSRPVGFPIPLFSVLLILVLFVVAVVLTIVCLVLFFHKTKKKPQHLSIRCPSCGNQVSESADFCTYCGTKLR